MITVYDYFGKIKENVVLSNRLINNRLIVLKIINLLRTVYPNLTTQDTLMWFMFEKIAIQDITKSLPEIQGFIFEQLTKHCLAPSTKNSLKLLKAKKIELVWIYHHPFINHQDEYTNFNHVHTVTSKQAVILKNGISLSEYKQNLPVVYFSSLRFQYRVIINEIFSVRIPDIVSLTQDQNVTEFIHGNVLYKLKRDN
jgi:hypothetical protein